MSEKKEFILKEINARLTNGSMAGTNEIGDIVDLIYDGWEELRDGFQIPDMFSLAGSLSKAYTGNKLAVAQGLDLQDIEIISMVNRSKDFDLGQPAREARQFVRWLLVTIQTYDVLIHERRNRNTTSGNPPATGLTGSNRSNTD